MSEKKLRVMIVDDSSFNRNSLADILRHCSDIEIVSVVDDPERALREAAIYRPDVLVMDVDMPRMGALAFLRMLMLQTPLPVLVSGFADSKHSVFQVLELGAYDFVSRPLRYLDKNDSALADDIIAKVLAGRSIVRGSVSKRVSDTVARDKNVAPQLPRSKAAPSVGKIERLIAIGASTGGPPALQAIFKRLSEGSRVAIVIAQHMPENFTKAFAERLNRISTMDVFEAEQDMLIRPGGAYVAPGGKHLEIRLGYKGLFCNLMPHDAGNRWVPSVDRLFISSAKAMQERMLAVVLTGMGTDGSQGVRAVFAGGGRVIAESEQTAIVYGMPKEAADTGCVHEKLALDGIVTTIDAYARGAERL